MVRRLIRIAATSLLALLILVGGGASLLLLSFDPNQYKAALSDALRERYHRSLDIQGRLVLHLLPPLTLDTGPMRLSEPDGHTPFAQAEGMQLHVDPLALLRLHIVIDRVTLDAPRLVVRRDADGRFNFSDLLRKGPADPSRRGPLDLQALRVHAGTLSLDDARSGLAGTLSGLELDLDGLGRPSPRPMQLRAHASFTRPALDAAIALQGNLRTGAGPVRIDGFVLRVDGSVGPLRRALLLARGDARYAAATPARLALHDISVHAAGRDTRDRPVNVDLALPSLEWDGDQVRSSAVDLRADVGASPAVTRVALHLPAAAGPAAALRVAGVTLDVLRGGDHAPTSRARLGGTLVLGLGARTASIDDAKLKGNWLLPWGSTLPLDLQGRMAWAPGPVGATAALAGTIAGTGVQLAAATDAGVLTVHADADTLDMDAPGVPPNALPSMLAQALPLLDWLDVDARLGAGQLRIHGTRWTAAQARLRQDGHALIVAPAEAHGFGGTVTGAAVVETATGRTALALRGRDLQAGPLLSALAGSAWLHGTLDGTGQWVLDNAGAPQSVSGGVHVAVHDGAIVGVDVGAALRAARANALGPARKTAFSMAEAHFTIARGVAHSADLDLRAGAARLTGGATLDLRTHTLALALTAREAAATVSVSAGGPLKAPHYTLTWPRPAAAHKEPAARQAGAAARPVKSRQGHGVKGASPG